MRSKKDVLTEQLILNFTNINNVCYLLNLSYLPKVLEPIKNILINAIDNNESIR